MVRCFTTVRRDYPLPMLRAFCLLALLSVLFHLLPAAERGMKPMTVTDERGGTVTLTSSRALIIGNSAYVGDWDELKGVREDVEAVQAALEQQGFAVQVSQNLTKTQMNEVMDAFIAEQAQDPTGRVVIYYAGHGQTVGTVGYLVPVDAPKPTNPQFKAKAYPISILKIKAQEAVARHVLFACDSCFSGSVFTPMRGANEYVLSAAREPVRMFLTAGSADETVPDVSFFRQEFVRGIGGAADLNRDGYVTGSELSTHIKQTVRDRAGAMGKKLTPQAGVSEQEGLNRGDIVFAVPGTGVATPPPAPPPAASGSDNLQARIEAERQTAVVRQQWDAWQGKMSVAFDAAQQAADQRLSAALRTDIWQGFLRDWATDNPFSTDDERLRMAAQAGVAALGTAKPVWATATGKDQYGTWADLQVAGVTQRFRWIQPGTFTMGSPQSEKDELLASVPNSRLGWFSGEVQHQVTLTQSFWLADSACTQALWQTITGTNPAHFKDSPLNPVEKVSWDDCQRFLATLNGRVSGGGFRLPSEAQWEYACRAGTSTAFSFGSTITPEQVNYHGSFPFGGAARGLYRQKTVPVKSLPPNAWGLYEMHGNVWQWCNDWYGVFSGSAERDPTGPSSGSKHVHRGGCWSHDAWGCRSAARNWDAPDYRYAVLGFRIAAQATP